MKKSLFWILLLSLLVIVSGCNFLARPAGSVNGTITDSVTGEGVPGASVKVDRKTVTTNAEGKYLIDNVAAGEQDVTVTRAGYVSQTVKVVVIDKQTVTKDIVLVGHSVYGQVTFGGVAVEGATVMIADQSVQTDAEGNYSFSDVAAGTYVLSASKSGFITAQVTLTLNYGDSIQQNLALIAINGIISGYVTNGRGGPAVGNAEITWHTYSTLTNEDGYFELGAPTGVTADLYVRKDSFATLKVQDVQVIEDEVKTFELPLRLSFNPNWSTNPPTISVEGIEYGQEVFGEITFTVKVVSADGLFPYVGYVYLGGEQRFPRDGFLLEQDEISVTIDTTKTPNGPSFIKVLAYDSNENNAMYIMPITINNDVPLPDDIAGMNLTSTTMGVNIGFYVNQRREYFEKHGIDKDPAILEVRGEIMDLNAAPANASIANKLTWAKADGADGYSVYRSFDEENFVLIGHVKQTSLDDYSPLLAADKKTTYKVVPYNRFGEGTPFLRSVTPLPAINVYLEEPGNDTHNVVLNPTFTWDLATSSPLPEDVELYSVVTLFDVTEYMVWEGEVYDAETATLPFDLAPGGVYSWDVAYAEASMLYSNDATGYSYAVSLAGEGEGSLNGEFVFTTTVTE